MARVARRWRVSIKQGRPAWPGPGFSSIAYWPEPLTSYGQTWYQQRLQDVDLADYIYQGSGLRTRLGNTEKNCRFFSAIDFLAQVHTV